MNNQNKEHDDGLTEQILNRMERNSSDTNSYIANGIMVPPPPKPGEPIICQYCGKIVYPDDFSEDPFQRKFEFKWHLHPQCKQAMEDEADRFTPGLVSERKKAMGEYATKVKTKTLTSRDTGVVSKKCKRITPVKEFGKKIPKRNA